MFKGNDFHHPLLQQINRFDMNIMYKAAGYCTILEEKGNNELYRQIRTSRGRKYLTLKNFITT